MSYRIPVSSSSSLQTTLLNETATVDDSTKHVPPIKESDNKALENVKPRNGIIHRFTRARQVKSSEVVSALKQVDATSLLILPNDTRRSRNRFGEFLFALATEEKRTTRQREIRKTNELKTELADIVSQNHGDVSMVPAMAVAVKQLRELQGALGPIEDDLSVLLKFSDAEGSNRMFSVSVIGYDVRQISDDALTKAQLACQYQLTDQTLKCKCDISDSHTVTLTVDSGILVEEEEGNNS